MCVSMVMQQCVKCLAAPLFNVVKPDFALLASCSCPLYVALEVGLAQRVIVVSMAETTHTSLCGFGHR